MKVSHWSITILRGIRLSRFVLFLSLGLLSFEAQAYVPKFSTNAKQIILVDLSTGTILFEKDSDKIMFPSSMTKVMSMYIVFDRLRNGQISMDDEFQVSQKAWKRGGSTTFLNVNQRVSVEDLLRGAIVQSGNDATITLAEGISSDEDNFVEEMNLIARELGMHDTQFRNSTGWPEDGHYTTAKDLMILSKAIIEKFPEYYSLWAEKEFTFNKIRQPNRNPLVQKVRGGEGLKTGSTERGGYGLIGTVQRDGRRILMVANGFSNDRARSEGSVAIAEWAFREFDLLDYGQKGGVAISVPVKNGVQQEVNLVYAEEPKFTIPRILAKRVKQEFSLVPDLTAPIQKGQIIGKMKLFVPEQSEPLSVAVLAETDVEKAGLFRRAYRKIKNIF